MLNVNIKHNVTIFFAALLFFGAALLSLPRYPFWFIIHLVLLLLLRLPALVAIVSAWLPFALRYRQRERDSDVTGENSLHIKFVRVCILLGGGERPKWKETNGKCSYKIKVLIIVSLTWNVLLFAGTRKKAQNCSMFACSFFRFKTHAFVECTVKCSLQWLQSLFWLFQNECERKEIFALLLFSFFQIERIF